MKKRMWAWALVLCMAVGLFGCGTAGQAAESGAIESYRQIPGVSQQEIAQIEAIKAAYGSFTYGHLNVTESFRREDGTYAGFTIALCQLLSELFGAEFSPVIYDEWADLKRDIDNCVTHFSGEFTQTAERMQTYAMTKPIAGRGLNVYTLASAPAIESEADISGKRVGFLEGTVAFDLIAEFYPDSRFEAVNIGSVPQVVEMLRAGQIDAYVAAGVTDTQFEQYEDIRGGEIFRFVYAPVSITTMDQNLAPIITVIDKYLAADGMDRMFSLYQAGSEEYKKHKLGLSFTDEERAYLDDLKQRGAQVNIALQHDAYPASFYNTVEKRYDGAAYDILAEVSELTGIVFNSDCMPIEKPLSDILAKLKTDEVSMMPQLLYSESRKDDYIWSGISYITTNYALLSKSDYPTLEPFQVYHATVGTVNKSAHEEVFKALFPGHEKTKVYQTGDEGFDALERGEIDLLMLAETMLLVQTNYREKLGYKVNITFGKTLDTLFGYNKDETVLRDIIDKAMAFVDVKGIEENWLSRVFDYQRKMIRDMTPYIILAVSLLLAALCVVVIFYVKNRRISKNLEATVKERTHELERQTTTLSTIYRSIPDLVFCKDVRSVYTSCNPTFERFMGMGEAEIIGKSDFEIFKANQEMAQGFVEADRKVLGLQNVEKIEERVTYPDGSQKFMETVRAPLVQNDQVIGMMGISRDITERKAAEAVLEKRLKQQRLMATLSQNFIANGDVDEQITESLRLIGEFMGISRVLLMQLDGQSVRYRYEWDNPAHQVVSKLGMVMPVADTEWRVIAALAQRRVTHFCLDDIGHESVAQQYRAGEVKNFIMMPVFIGDELWGALDFAQCNQYTPWTSSDINLGEMVAGVLSGVMSRQYMEDKLVEAKELAEQNSRAKSDFLSRMSHEMRTPMNAIIGMTSIGKNAEDIERKDYCLGKIDSASTHLLGVINDVLDISKIEAGKFELSKTDFSLEKMLIKITNVVNFRMEEKHQSFTIKVDPDVPQAVVTDEQRLSQVITNLLGNAVKFTPENGTIALFVRKIAEESGAYTLEFEVRDNGIGISEEQQKKLFTSFEQGDGSVSRKYGGTGLGLAISRHIVEMMDGRIWVESRVGEGSRFIFTIRAQRGYSQGGLQRGDINWSGLRVLAVDDEEDVREYFLSLAKPLNFQCAVAASGAEACARIDRGEVFDIFFVDWKMAGMDGIELTRRIKDQCSENSVVIMISGADWSYIEADARQAGVDRFIPKPLFSSVITECIQDCLAVYQNAADDVREAEGEDGIFEGKRILLAEDVDVNREIIIALLGHTGLQIDCAEDGAAAYRMFQKHPDYDMIFMDIHMPEVDGYTATRMIRALDDPRARAVPIIAMTANVFREDIERCLAAGMNAHVGKPIDIEAVMEKLKRYLLPAAHRR